MLIIANLIIYYFKKVHINFTLNIVNQRKLIDHGKHLEDIKDSQLHQVTLMRNTEQVSKGNSGKLDQVKEWVKGGLHAANHTALLLLNVLLEDLTDGQVGNPEAETGDYDARQHDGYGDELSLPRLTYLLQGSIGSSTEFRSCCRDIIVVNFS